MPEAAAREASLPASREVGVTPARLPGGGGVPRRIDSLQAARGIAAAMIVLFHARDWSDPVIGRPALDWLVAPAPSFIDMFFVISGFIMVATTRPGTRPVEFAIRRFTRIWPSYAVVTAVFLTALPLLARATHVAIPVDQAPGAVLRALMFLPGDPDADPPFFGFPPLHVGWTLNYEAWFYAVFCVSLAFGRLRMPVLFAVLLCGLVAVPFVSGAAPSLVVWRNHHLGGVGILSVASSPMDWDFLAGCLLALAWRTRLHFPGRETAMLAILVSAAFAAWLQCDRFGSTFGPRALLSWLPLLACLVIAEKTFVLPVPRSLIRLGEISFSLYLVHPLVTDGLAVVLRARHPAGLPVAGIPYALFLLALSVALAAASHALLEVRLSTWLRAVLLRAAAPARRSPGR